MIKDLKSSASQFSIFRTGSMNCFTSATAFTVLRSGRVVGRASRSEVSRQWIVERMSGRTDVEAPRSSADNLDSEVLLSVEGWTLGASTAEEAAQSPLHAVSFTLRRGEILGIYGLLGAGRTELLESLAGARPALAGSLVLNGVEASVGNVPKAVRSGIVLVPEDRQRDGLIPELSIRENIAIGYHAGTLAFERRATGSGPEAGEGTQHRCQRS